MKCELKNLIMKSVNAQRVGVSSSAWLDDLMSFESVGFPLEFRFATRTVANRDGMNKNVSAALQGNAIWNVVRVTRCRSTPSNVHNDGGIISRPICTNSNKRDMVLSTEDFSVCAGNGFGAGPRLASAASDDYTKRDGRGNGRKAANTRNHLTRTS